MFIIPVGLDIFGIVMGSIVAGWGLLLILVVASAIKQAVSRS